MILEEIRVLVRLAKDEQKPTVAQVRQVAGVPAGLKFMGEEQQGNAPDDRLIWFRFTK
jgi:hypothetical protein